MKLFKSLMLILLGSSAFAAGGIGVIQGDAVTFSSMVVTGNVTLNGTCTGTGCGGGGGGSTNGTVTAAPQYAPTYYTLSGTTTTVGGLTPNTSGYPILSGGSSAAPFEGPLSGANVSGNISGNAANITGNLAAAQVAAGSLGASVIASSHAVNSITPTAIIAGTYSNITLPAANVAAGSLGASVIASSVTGSGVVAGQYGSTTISPVITVTADGRITAVSSATIAGGGGASLSSTNTWTAEQIFSTNTVLPGTTYYANGNVASNSPSFNLSGATQLVVPSAAGAIPTAVGDIRYDTTNNGLRSYMGILSSSGAISQSLVLAPTNDVLYATNTITAITPFATTFNFPANFWTVGKTVKVTLGLQYLAAATIPTSQIFAEFTNSGSTPTVIISSSSIGTPVATTTLIGSAAQYYFTCLSTGAGGTIFSSVMGTGANNTPNRNLLGGPIAFDTTIAQTLKFAQLFSAGNSGNMNQLAFMIVEVMN